MAKKKARRCAFPGTNVLDYPSGMSQYEKERLAAEAKLAELRKMAKGKTRQPKEDFNQVAFRLIR